MPSSFDQHDKQNRHAGRRGAKQRFGPFPVPSVPRDVKVSCNRPKPPEAICWNNPTFFDPTQQNPTPDPMTNQTDDSTTTYPSDIQNSSANDSSDGPSSPPRDRDFSIRHVDDIIIESREKILDDGDSEFQMATHFTPIRAMEAPISESIYAPPKFETNVNSSMLGEKRAWKASYQHSFLGLRYTTYEPSSKTFRRKRVALGLYSSDGATNLKNDSDAYQVIGTQSDINYEKLIDVMKSIPKYFSDRPKYKMAHPLFKKTNNCNSFVYSMAKQAGLKDIAKLHHTLSPGSAANKLLKHMRRGKIDLNRVRVELDGTNSKLMRRPVFVQEKGGVSLGLKQDDFLTEACHIMENYDKRRSNNPDIRCCLQTINLAINKINDILKQLSGLDNKDEMVAHVQDLFPLLTTIDSNILKTVKLASGKHKMLQIYLMGILDFFHTVRNELLGLRSYSSSSDSSSSEFLASEQEDSIDSEPPHSFEHRPSAQTAFCFKNLLGDASFQNYTKDLLELSQKDCTYNENLLSLTKDKANKQLKEKYDDYEALLTTEKMKNNIKTRANLLNNIILRNYEAYFIRLMKHLKIYKPEQPIEIVDAYDVILTLYRDMLEDEQNQNNLADYVDLYTSIINCDSGFYDGLVKDLLKHLKATLLDAGITYKHKLYNLVLGIDFQRMIQQAVIHAKHRRRDRTDRQNRQTEQTQTQTQK